MKYCKSKCAEKQEVNSALLYESCFRQYIASYFSPQFSQREVSAIDVWLSKGLSQVKVKHELRSCNPEGVKAEENVSEQQSQKNYSSLMIICP